MVTSFSFFLQSAALNPSPITNAAPDVLTHIWINVCAASAFCTAKAVKPVASKTAAINNGTNLRNICELMYE
jgi:hypothetical protein